MNKSQLLSHCGNLEQMAGIRQVTIEGGVRERLRALEVKSGPISFNVLADKAMDIADFSYKGMNLSFLAKPGLGAANIPLWKGAEAVNSLVGGLLFTGGPENIAASCEEGGRAYGLHGSMRSLPAEKMGYDARWQGNAYTLSLWGEMRYAQLFGANTLIRRHIETELGSNRITLTDTVENQCMVPQPVSILYHLNLGYPLLAEGTRILVPGTAVSPRDDIAAQGMDTWSRMGPPVPGKAEEVFQHTPAANAQGETFAAALNDELGLGLCFRFRQDTLPRFYQWKCEAAGDYALGLEPTNANILGRAEQMRTEGSLHMLQPLASETFSLVIEVLEGAEAFRALEEEAQALTR